MARTLAQQNGCPLLGVSSYYLMASRLVDKLPVDDRTKPFWITENLPRRGMVAGKYQIDGKVVMEIETPHLITSTNMISPSLEKIDNAAEDVRRLLIILENETLVNNCLPWDTVLPIYPTSPVEI